MLPDVVQLGKGIHRAEERQQNHGGDAVKDQLAAREKEAGPTGMAEGLVVLTSNAGGGKGRQLEAAIASGE